VETTMGSRVADEVRGQGRDVRILLVDDSRADLDLMERALLDWGLRFECVRARGRREFLAGLEGPSLDLVISDYVLPDLGGLEVLDLVGKRHPLAPVIVVTGAVDERTVMACIEAGAADYVLKDHLLRLPIAALNAMEKARALAERVRSEEKYRLLVEHLPLVAFSLDLEPSLRLTFVSRRVTKVLDFPPSRWTRERGFLLRRIYRHDRSLVLGAVREARRSGELPELTFRILGEGDRIRWVRVQASSVVRNGDGRAVIQGVLRDISEQKEAELERDLLWAAAEQSSSMVVITDLEGGVHYVNRGFEALTGYAREEALGRNLRELLRLDTEEGENEAMWEALEAGEAWQGEFRNRRKDGTPYVSRATLSPIHDHNGHVTRVVGISQDVTAQKAMEAQIRQMQKVETVGQLTGGIAHDMNNILTAVVNFTALAMGDLGPGQTSIKEDLEQVSVAARRGTDLIRKLMTFSRKEGLELEVLDVGDVVLGLHSMLRRILPETMRITVAASGPEARCRADEGALGQILVNLCTNARDAMPHGGDLHIQVDEVHLDLVPPGASRRPGPGLFVRIRVRDTGEGMGEDVKERIFEPFFTTKPKGKGTGLGMAVVANLVEQHGGFVTVESTPGRGTTMSVHLPALPSGDGGPNPHRDGSREREEPPSGKLRPPAGADEEWRRAGMKHRKTPKREGIADGRGRDRSRRTS
jgi:two-component system, cell cycle sensor histidine kinase and response regulator CckA